MEEVMGLLPRRLAAWLDDSPRLRDWLASRLSRGRPIRTHTLRGTQQLKLVAGLRRWRRSSRRPAEELGHLQARLAEVQQVLPHDPPPSLQPPPFPPFL